MNSLRLGIPFITNAWLGGVNYVIHLFMAAHTLPADLRPRLVLVVPDKFLNERAVLEHRSILPLADLIIAQTGDAAKAARLLGPGALVCPTREAVFEHIDYLYPVHSDVFEGLPSASWIPDFQHKILPEFCDADELHKRDLVDRKVAERARHVVFSSEAARRDFRRFFPDSPAHDSILHFSTIPEPEWFEGDPDAVRQRYGLPENYLICCNQFWMHKDHKTLFSAVAAMKKMGRALPLVCTGPTQDYRNRGFFDELKALIAALGIADLVHILGAIDRGDQIQLLRGAAAVVQPSLFEGWSTVVEDCRVLGKTIFLTDIDVHQEQAPAHGIPFKAGDPADLVQKILTHPQALGATHGTSREAEARREGDQRMRLFGLRLARIAQQGVELFAQDAPAPVPPAPEPPRPEPVGPTITTSIAPKGIEKQQRAVASWLAQGFAVESLNPADEIPDLKEHFPEVSFIPVERDGREHYGKPLVFLDDIFAHFKRSSRRICAIVNSDIILRGVDLKQRLAAEALDSFVFGSRVDVKDADSTEGEIYRKGFDYFFFDRKVLDLFPPTIFCIGATWWDYWIAAVPLLAGVAAKQVDTPTAYHPEHPYAWSHDTYVLTTREAIRALGLQGISPDAIPAKGWTREHLELCWSIADQVLEMIHERSVPLSLDGGTTQDNETWPRISIVTPSYNQGDSIEATIRSVLDQGYPNLEYIIMDGGSTDGTVDVIRRFEDKIDHWVSEPDKGQSHAINKGLARATGEIFNWLNSDDWLEPGALHRLAEAWRENPDAVAWAGGCRRVDPEGHELSIIYPNGMTLENMGENWNGRQFYQPSCFLSTAAVRDEGGVDVSLEFCMDLHLWLRLARRGRFVAGRGVWTTALIHPKAKTQSMRKEMHLETVRTIKAMGFPRGAAARERHALTGGAHDYVMPADLEQRIRALRDPDRAEGLDLTDRSIAVVSNFLPRHDRSSANLRLLEIIRLMRRAGATLEYLYFYETDDDARYAEDLGIPARRLTEHPEAVAEALGVTPPDVLWLSNLWTPEFMAMQLEGLPAVRDACPGTHLIVDTMDLHSQKSLRRFEQLGNPADQARARAFLALERTLYAQAEHVVAVCETEKQAILRVVPEAAPVAVVPNIHRPVQAILPRERRRHLVFLGNYEVDHNADAARYFVAEVLPHILKRRTDIQIHFAGHGAQAALGDLGGANVRLVGRVPDVAEALAAYRVFVCPMTYGTGLKGKVGMAAASGLPFVTTSVGAEGFGFTDGEQCFIADDPEEFALKTLHLYDDNVAWSNFSLRGVLAMAEGFSPRAAGAALQPLLAGG